MLGTVLCMLLGYATGQKLYYLGDDITVTISRGIFNATTLEKIVFAYYILSSSGDTIPLAGPNVTVGRLHPTKTVKLSADLGTFAMPQRLPAYVSGMAKIYARASEPLKHQIQDAVVENITISRHIQHVASSGKVEMWGKRTLTFNVEYTGPQIGTPTNASDWVIALVQNDTNPHLFKTYDTMKVTSVMPPNNMTTFYTLSGTWQKTSPPPMSGLYVVIGLKNGTSTRFNTWSVTGNSLNAMYSWVVVNSSFAVMAPASVTEFNLTTIKMNDGGVTTPGAWWLVAHESATGKQYALGCAPKMASAYSNFDWKVLPLQPMDTTAALPVGNYFFEAIWTDRTAPQSSFMDANYPRISLPNTKLNVLNHGSNAMTPITFNGHNAHKLGQIQKNQNLTVDVYSIFSTVYIQWFKMQANYTNSSNGPNTTGWFPEGPAMPYQTVPGQVTKIWTVVPVSVFNNISKTAKSARLYGWAKDCQGNHFAQSFVSGNLSNPSPSNGGGGNKTLGAGAIVGIVCAVVFVCGVAAWWLCMKNSNSADRYQKLGGDN